MLAQISYRNSKKKKRHLNTLNNFYQHLLKHNTFLINYQVITISQTLGIELIQNPNYLINKKILKFCFVLVNELDVRATIRQRESESLH